ncbi:Centromere protein T [Coniochaeta hoffmannii]|uniref:Centromere protein T n=1 Tax=Coniochaeta hoffmannii TaxID=91930 RepID=A0AA38RZJ9_9PEZI|nr:Centromere protein T [Coniochaeta hoffmannii]
MADDTTTPSAPPPTTSTPRQIPITTPSRRAFSAEPPTALRPRSVRTPGSNRRNQPATATTPHGRAAIRALDSRRAAIFTPGRRRRSLRDQQRETPRDLLRALSRNLAGKTGPVPASSSPRNNAGGSAVKSEADFGTGAFAGHDDDDEGDEVELRAPRMSLPIDEDDDDGDWPRPHHSAGLELLDDNLTIGSVEFGRRALSEGPRRSSVGLRLSDFQARFDERGEPRSEDEAAIARRLHPVDERGALGLIEEEDSVMVTTTQRLEFERIEAEETRRVSDFQLEVPSIGPGNETTFLLQSEAVQEGEGPPFPDDEPAQLEDEPLQVADESHVHFADDVVFGEYQVEPEQEQEQGLEYPDDEVEEEEQEFPMEMHSALAKNAAAVAPALKKKKAGVKVSKHGIQYPSLPPAVVKRLAQTFARTSGVKSKISPDTLAAIMQASEWFFEQLGDDLQAYAKHAGRKTIDESDMLQLMRRQRQINASTTPFSLAQRYLPRELLQEMRMPPPAPAKSTRGTKFRRAQPLDPE